MKNLKLFSLVAIASIAFVSCDKKAKDGNVETTVKITKAEVDSASYAIGVSLGNMIKSANFGDLNYSEVNKAIQDVIKGKELKIKEEKTNLIIQQYAMKRQQVIAEENKIKGEKFLSENKSKDSVKTTESGLQYKVINAGGELKPTPVDTVTVKYRGTLLDGTEFDSSEKSPTPVKFVLANVIKGWIEGLQFIGEGGKIKLFIPAELAYGPQQAGPKITPNSTLIFDVELISVAKGQPVAPETPATPAPETPKK